MDDSENKFMNHLRKDTTKNHMFLKAFNSLAEAYKKEHRENLRLLSIINKIREALIKEMNDRNVRSRQAGIKTII